MLLYKITLGGDMMTRSSDINTLAIEMMRFQYEDLSSHMKIKYYIEKMNFFYDELKRLSYENYDGSSLSQGYKKTVRLLNDIEWHAPIHYICHVEDGFIHSENIITEIINMAYEEILCGSLDREFDYTGHCGEATCKIKKLCKKFGLEHQIIEINPLFDKKSYSPFEEMLGDSIRHYASLITLNDKKYLVDITYRQFFMINQNNINRIGVPYLNSCNPGFFMIKNESYKKIAQHLVNFGWIEATDQNLKAYFDGFAISFRNGIYYEDMKDFIFKTDYQVEDYISFLKGNESQSEKEPVFSLGRQMRPLKGYNNKRK